MVWLTLLMVSRYEYQKGLNALANEQYNAAWHGFITAENRLPQALSRLLAPRDLFRIHLALGEALYALALASGERHIALEQLERALDYLKRAVAVAPLSYRAQLWLARVTAALEAFFPLVHGEGETPYDAMPYFQEAAGLRPSGVTVHYEMHRDATTLPGK
ncbi:MAG: hypothetical protein HQK65_17660 [Desulfamplus sp.]|nr:hypothetical protein [Desulfamplus sp.]